MERIILATVRWSLTHIGLLCFTWAHWCWSEREGRQEEGHSDVRILLKGDPAEDDLEFLILPSPPGRVQGSEVCANVSDGCSAGVQIWAVLRARQIVYQLSCMLPEPKMATRIKWHTQALSVKLTSMRHDQDGGFQSCSVRTSKQLQMYHLTLSSAACIIFIIHTCLPMSHSAKAAHGLPGKGTIIYWANFLG